MQSLRRLCIPLVLATFPLCAAAQGPSDIVLETPETLEFGLRMSIAAGTQRVLCYQLEEYQVVGSANVTAGNIATVPIALPDPVIRCAACNDWGCSTLSSNAAVLIPANPLDFDLSGGVDVNDMLMCYARIRDEIY
jgi:hypothetical protein